MFISSYNRNTFGIGTGAILYAGLNCTGTELSLRECNSNYNTPQYCSHYSGEVGVRCDHIENSGIANCVLAINNRFRHEVDIFYTHSNEFSKHLMLPESRPNQIPTADSFLLPYHLPVALI